MGHEEGARYAVERALGSLSWTQRLLEGGIKLYAAKTVVVQGRVVEFGRQGESGQYEQQKIGVYDVIPASAMQAPVVLPDSDLPDWCPERGRRDFFGQAELRCSEQQRALRARTTPRG